MFIAGMFTNLHTLVVSPQHLSNDIVRKLGTSKVTNLHIIQDQYCYESYFIDNEIWKGIFILFYKDFDVFSHIS